jgi:hypothetical protein
MELIFDYSTQELLDKQPGDVLSIEIDRIIYDFVIREKETIDGNEYLILERDGVSAGRIKAN